MNTSWGWRYSSTILDFGIDGIVWSPSRPGRFTSRERAPGTHWIGGLVGHRAGLDAMEKRKFLTLPGLELRPLARPARSLSLYRLRYRGLYADIKWANLLKYNLFTKRGYYFVLLRYWISKFYFSIVDRTENLSPTFCNYGTKWREGVDLFEDHLDAHRI
jgi:hypothetical protein